MPMSGQQGTLFPSFHRKQGRGGLHFASAVTANGYAIHTGAAPSLHGAERRTLPGNSPPFLHSASALTLAPARNSKVRTRNAVSLRNDQGRRMVFGSTAM